MNVRFGGACLLVAALAVLAPVLAPAVAAQEVACPGGATVPQATGSIFVVSGGARAPLSEQARLCPGAILETGAESRATLILEDGASVFRVDAATRVAVGAAGEGRGALELLRGAIYFLSRVPRVLTIETPSVNAGIEGTEMLVRVDDGVETWTMLQGRAQATTPAGPAELRDGERLEVRGGAVVRIPPPADAPPFAGFTRADLDWTLFYPPVLVADATTDPALREAVRALDAGRVDAARARLDAVTDTGRTWARKRALLAVVDVARNAPDAALARLADDDAAAVPAVAVARSYALQAQGELTAARDVLRASTAGGGAENALVWARLAELELAFGARRAALEAADRAAGLADRGETRIVQGFAALLAFDLRSARLAFEAALARDAQNPLAHLGLALAAIRGGDLAAGERALEVAVAQDPNRALTRSYLGKAYAEAFRDAKAGTQLDIAKALDPADPTPWYYDALRKADANRPVEALADLEQAQQLNDNRFVTRSRLLLDSDRAARSVTGARLFAQLGLEQRGRVAAGVAAMRGPFDATADRFLAESFAGDDLLGVARAGAALRADLAAPPGRTLLPPTSALNDFNLASRSNVLALGLNEYTRFFEQEGASVAVDAFAGTQSLVGNQALVSAFSGPFSLAASQLFSDTDGWRTNSDVRNEAYRLQGKWALSPAVTFTLDGFTRDSEQGELGSLFDPDPELTRTLIDRSPGPPGAEQVVTTTLSEARDRRRFAIDERAVTAGVSVTPAPATQALLAVTWAEREETSFLPSVGTTDVALDFGGFEVPVVSDLPSSLTVDGGLKRDGVQVDGLMSHAGDRWRASVGGLWQEGDERSDIDFDLDVGADTPAVPLTADIELDHQAAFGYGAFDLTRALTAQAGLSFDRVVVGEGEIEEFNPKIGAVWQPSPALQLRAAAFRTVARSSLIVERSLEPTTFAGFTQFEDDRVGAHGWAYGLGADARLSDTVVVGAEAVARRYDVPLSELDGTIFGDEAYRVDRVDAYAGWTPHPRWAFTVAPAFEQVFRQDASVGDFEPSVVKTLSAPVAARYFDPSGWFAELRADYLHQLVRRSEDQPAALSGVENVVLLGARAGWRLPRRLGVVEVVGENLLGQDVRYQDRNFRSSNDESADRQAPRYISEPTLLVRVRLQW